MAAPFASMTYIFFKEGYDSIRGKDGQLLVVLQSDPEKAGGSDRQGQPALQDSL